MKKSTCYADGCPDGSRNVHRMLLQQAATETTAAAAAATAGTVKIGMSGPLTGGASLTAWLLRPAWKWQLREINAKGRPQIEFNAQDDEADGEKAVVRLQRPEGLGYAGSWPARSPPVPLWP